MFDRTVCDKDARLLLPFHPAGRNLCVMVLPIETEIEMVKRHVLRGEAIIARQHALILRLRNAGASIAEAERLLEIFQSIQTENLIHLSRLAR